MGFAKRLKTLVRPGSHGEELNDELQFHLEMRMRELVAQGVEPGEAERRVRAGFGSLSSIKERTREMDIVESIESLVNDTRFALRSLKRSRTACVVGILTLALGIGANTAIFSVVHSLLIAPLPFTDSDRIILVSAVDQKGREDFINYTDMLDWRTQSKTLENFSAYVPQSVNLTGEREPDRLIGAFVSSNFFELLDVQTALGRGFLQGDDLPGASAVAIITHDLWQNRYGGDASILGRKITLNNDVFIIAGVLPASFKFAWSAADAYVPFIYYPNYAPGKRGGSNAAGFARVRAGYSLEQAAAEMTAIARAQALQFPETNNEKSVRLRRFQDFLMADIKSSVLFLWGAVSLVFLIACANLANISVARMLAREREISIRSALGAGKLRLMRQVLLENLLLAFGGSAIGILLGYWARAGIAAVRTQILPFQIEVFLGWEGVVFALGLGLLGALVCTAIPALRLLRAEQISGLREDSRTSSGSRREGWSRRALVVVEIGLCLILVAGAGLLLRSFSKLSGIDPGFSTDNLLTLEYRVPRTKYPKPEQQWQFHNTVLEKVSQVPGVKSASAVLALPFSGNFGETTMILPDRPQPARGSEPRTAFNRASPGWFAAMKIPLLQGRYIEERDREGAPSVAVVSRTFAQRIWPDKNPIGQRVVLPELNNRSIDVVGVVGDIRHRHLGDNVQVQMYVSYAQLPHIFSTLVVETSGNPESYAAAVRKAVWSVDKDQPVWKVRTMQSLMDRYLNQMRLLPSLLTGFSIFALLLAALGVYGVISYSTERRTREIGLRIAVGAKPADVLSLILRDGMLLTLIGVAVGIGGALASGGVLQRFVFDLSPYDPLNLAASALVLMLIALAAAYIPARRTLKLDPVSALRQD